MSEETKGVSNTPDATVSDGAQETQGNVVSNDDNQTIQYHTHKKLLGQHKKLAEEADALREQLKAMQNEKYESEGNKDQLIESLKKEVVDYKTKLKSAVGSFAEEKAMSAIADEAVKAGCNSTEVVKEFLKGKIDSLNFDESFAPDREQVRDLISEAKKAAPVLFSTSAPKLANHNAINSNAVTSGETKTLKNMSDEELMSALSSSAAQPN